VIENVCLSVVSQLNNDTTKNLTTLDMQLIRQSRHWFLFFIFNLFSSDGDDAEVVKIISK
jgi:hypothetical protein